MKHTHRLASNAPAVVLLGALGPVSLRSSNASEALIWNLSRRIAHSSAFVKLPPGKASTCDPMLPEPISCRGGASKACVG